MVRKVHHVHDLEVNKAYVKELRKANKIDIYLIVERCYGRYEDTYYCTKVYLKTDQGECFHIEGITENFGAFKDEEFSIIIEKGWPDFEIHEKENGKSIIFRDENLEDTSKLFLFDTFINEEGSSIEVKHSTEEFLNIYPVKVDKGLLFTRKDKSMFIGLDYAPLVIMATKDPEYMNELKKWWD
jgi:hypothetical protein